MKNKMAKLKRVKVYIVGEEFELTPKQLLNKLSKLKFWDFQDFLDNNPTENFNHFKHKDRIIKLIKGGFDCVSNEYNERKLDRLELDRQEERVCSDQPIYPQGWYEKQDKEIIYGKLAR